MSDIKISDVVRIKDAGWHEGWLAARAIVLEVDCPSGDDEPRTSVNLKVMMLYSPSGTGIQFWNIRYLEKVC